MNAQNDFDNTRIAAHCLLERFSTHVVALMAYGSRVYGRPRRGSAHDFWLIVDDPAAFHQGNAAFYRTHLNIPSTPDEQIRRNLDGPNFYSLSESGMEIKFGVLGEESFCRLCRDAWWTVKGRMQKPLRFIKSSPGVKQAVRAARQEGLHHALNMAPRDFGFNELMRELVALSYRAELRPEHMKAKVQSILDSGGEALDRIYRPMLDAQPNVEKRGETYVDLRDDETRRYARRATLQSLRRSKWSRRSFRYIIRNFRSHRAPIRYILKKGCGEIEKAFARIGGRK